MSKQPIPEGLNPDEIFAYMHSHGFKNRHPAVGPHVGMAITYYELVEHQREKNNGEQEWRANALKDEIHQDSRSTEDTQAVEDDRGRDGKQREPLGMRDSISVSDDAGSTGSTGEDSEANGGAESGRSNPNGNASGRTRVGNERPNPDAPLRDKLAYWGPRLIQREREED